MLLSQILIENVSEAKNEAKRVFMRTIASKIAGEMSCFFKLWLKRFQKQCKDIYSSADNFCGEDEIENVFNSWRMPKEPKSLLWIS